MFAIVLFALGLVSQQMPTGFPQKGRPAPPFVFADVITPKDATSVAAADLTPERLRGKVVVLDSSKQPRTATSSGACPSWSSSTRTAISRPSRVRRPSPDR